MKLATTTGDFTAYVSSQLESMQYIAQAGFKYAESVTSDVVEKLHSLGMKVNVWTVNDPKATELLAKMGVDFITSNF